MNKRKLHHVWVKLRPISYWYFLIACLVFGVIGVFAMRQNNLNAIKLRDEVLAVDKENGDVEAALRKLRAYVYAHMNTELSSGTSTQQPVQLKYRYERLVAAEKARVEAANQGLYDQGLNVCRQQFPGNTSVLGPVAPCTEAYVAARSTKEQPIPDALYKFSFAAPRWSADLAGISLLLSAVFGVLFVLRFILERIMRASLNHHL